MPLRISASLKKALGDELKIEKSDVEDYVWNHKEQKCFLCSAKLNRASDNIELDHDVPAGEGGGDEFKNLNLTHVECNRYKKNHNSFDVRPHLRFKRFYEDQLGQVHFGDALGFFQIAPTDCYIKICEGDLTAEVSSETGVVTVKVHEEEVAGKNQRFCFATLPISCVENDNEIQPREIKLNHLFMISSDLKKNPLHEQPAIRVTGDTEKKKLLMFDGQHKTVAHLLNGKRNCVFKIYLNISKPEAVELVNSIQAKIKKLPLTPFELASKMSDEVRRKLELYEDQIGSTEVSEEGFISWLDPADRTRAKSGIESAVIDRIIGDDELAFIKLIERKGVPSQTGIAIKEAAFQKNVLKNLLHTKPISSSFKGEAMKEAREREARNILKILNLAFDKGFTPLPDKDTETEIARIKRLSYQASLRILCDILMRIVATNFYADAKTVLLEKEIGPELTTKLSSAADRFFAHPVWVADLSNGTRAQAVDDALKKNQNIEEAFRSVGLTAAYCADLEQLPTNWAGT